MYTPEIMINFESVINYYKYSHNIRGIHTVASGLESTSIVFAYGLGRRGGAVVKRMRYDETLFHFRSILYSRVSIAHLRSIERRLRFHDHWLVDGGIRRRFVCRQAFCIYSSDEESLEVDELHTHTHTPFHSDSSSQKRKSLLLLLFSISCSCVQRQIRMMTALFDLLLANKSHSRSLVSVLCLSSFFSSSRRLYS